MRKKFVPFSSARKAGCPAASGLPSTPLPRRRLHRSEAGVTLMEMLVASIVMLFVMAGLATILVSTTQIQAYQNELAETQQNMRIVLTMTGDRTARAGTGLMPRTLAFQTAEEIWINNHYVKTKAEVEGLTQQNILFGVYYQRDFPGETAGAGAPILQPLTEAQYGANFGWKVNGSGADVNVKAPAAFLAGDFHNPGSPLTEPGLPILLYNVNLGNYITDSKNPPAGTAQKLDALYTKALHFTRLSGVSEHIDQAGDPHDTISRITVLHQPPVGAAPTGWAAGDTPILAYVGIAHAVFAYKQDILPGGMPDGKFYMAEFTPSTSSKVAEVKGQFDLYAENVYDLEVVGVFRDPTDGSPIRAQIFPALATFSTSITPSLGNALQDHYKNRVNLRETEITVTVRTGEPVPAGKTEGLYVPAVDTNYVYRVVRGSTRSHMQAYYMGFSAAAGATGG